MLGACVPRPKFMHLRQENKSPLPPIRTEVGYEVRFSDVLIGSFRCDDGLCHTACLRSMPSPSCYPLLPLSSNLFHQPYRSNPCHLSCMTWRLCPCSLCHLCQSSTTLFCHPTLRSCRDSSHGPLYLRPCVYSNHHIRPWLHRLLQNFGLVFQVQHWYLQFVPSLTL